MTAADGKAAVVEAAEAAALATAAVAVVSADASVTGPVFAAVLFETTAVVAATGKKLVVVA